jgi:hypothetical protein
VEGKLLLFGIVVALVLLVWLNLWWQSKRSGRGSQRAGHYRMTPQLGQEATDLETFNAVMSRNAPLGEVPQELQGLGRRHRAAVAPVKDDETYAARYHGAFGKTE